MQAPIKFYRGFWDEFLQLNAEAREDLITYLEKLQRNPDGAEMSERSREDRFAYQFTRDYVLYWRLERVYQQLPSLSVGAVTRIDVLAMYSIFAILAKGSPFDHLLARLRERLGLP